MPSDIALPAYSSSLHASRPLVEGILHYSTESPLNQAVSDIASCWFVQDLVLPSDPSRQQNWDTILCQKKLEVLKNSCDQHRLACLLAASKPHSGAWLSAIPSSSIGTLLDDDCHRFVVAMRVGARVCERHQCRCGRQVDEFGLHPLSCIRSAGRFPRHHAINDIIKRALDTAGFFSILEPAGLDQGDSKRPDGMRPDGMTIFPYSAGRPLVWDATCSDTFAPGFLAKSAADAGHAARAAEERKCEKYASLSARFTFTPVAVETTGVFGPRSLAFLERLGRQASKRTGDSRESAWLFQRISIAVVRGNVLCLLVAGREEWEH